MTLDQVARRCSPPTTPQTIGRLETGTRALSMSWLARLASAMDVDPHDLLAAPRQSELKVVATLGPGGASPPIKARIIVPPSLSGVDAGIHVTTSIGDYRTGDQLWCEILSPADYGQALNRDVLVPRSGDRLLFGRLINRDAEKLQILPLHAGGRQQVVACPPWLGLAKTLVRML